MKYPRKRAPLTKCEIQYIISSNHPLKKHLTPEEVAFATKLEQEEDKENETKIN